MTPPDSAGGPATGPGGAPTAPGASADGPPAAGAPTGTAAGTPAPAAGGGSLPAAAPDATPDLTAGPGGAPAAPGAAGDPVGRRARLGWLRGAGVTDPAGGTAWGLRRVRSGVVVGVFWGVAVVQLVAVGGDFGVVRGVRKGLLMPVLALWVWGWRGPRGLVWGLGWGWGGDVLLEVGGTVAFLAGMGCFAAGHVCYLRLFRRYGGFGGPRAAVRVRCSAYAVVCVVLVVLLWPGLDPGMRVPVALYSLLLTAMAAGAYGLGAAARTGGALFLLSDSLIATDLADWPQLPGPGVWVMATYAAGQMLLALGVLRASGGGPRAGRRGSGEGEVPGPASARAVPGAAAGAGQR
ncbi:lysoplasmalogenase [Streptomyces bryophytorum]|nr:lysoplasmalogenase [Actinacidiphila bryophytorum]